MISNSFNNYSNTLLVDNNTTKPNVIGCFNIPNLHYYMFEYNFVNNTVYSRDPMYNIPLGQSDTTGFYRMILAKTFGIIQDIVKNDGKHIYCGDEDR